MGELFVYILKSSLCLAVFYLFFMVALSKETLYRFNRYIIVLLFVLSLIIPFVNITIGSETSYSGVVLNIEDLLAMDSSDTGTGDGMSATSLFFVLIFVIYFAGLLTAFGRALVSFIQMIRIVRQKGAQKSRLSGGVSLIIHDKVLAPFSWMRFIVISGKDYEESGEEIITHELAHINNKHSIDLIVAEAVKIIHWFNPAAYLLKRELQNIHEYQADEEVIKHGIDAKKYQLLLIKKAVGDRLYSMANSFNHSKLKNRITMISKKKSQKRSTLKALFLLPLTMLAVVAFATEEVSTALKPVSDLKVTDLIQRDTIKTKMTRLIIKKVDEDGKDTLNVKGNVKWVTFDASADTANVIVFVDGVEKDKVVIKQIDPEAIGDIKVFKGERAVEKFGDRARNGVILISTKKSDQEGETNTQTVEKIVVKISDKDAKPLYVIDGNLLSEEGLNKIDPKTIEKIDVLKGEAAIKMYGEKGKNGVIMITLKK